MDGHRFPLDEYTRHPDARPLPEAPERWYRALRDGIRVHGLRIPIQVQRDTPWVLNGWYRLQACRDLLEQGINVQPRFEEVDRSDVPIDTACEASRRSLSPTQKALMAVSVLPEFERRARGRQELGAKLRQGDEGGKATAQAASLVGVSPRYVQYLAALKRDHPDSFERVERGEIDLQRALRELKRKGGEKGNGPNKPLHVPTTLSVWLDQIRREIRGETVADGLEALCDFVARHPDEWARFLATRTHAAA